MIRIRKGLDLPITGVPEQKAEGAAKVSKVALLGADYVGMKPTMEVQEGDTVKRGQLLFTDKKNAGVRFTAPAAGRVAAINRGEKRRFLSVVIETTGDDQVQFNAFPNTDLSTLSRDAVQDLLVESGLWTALRRRPFSKIPALTEQPHSLFIQAMDTNPLAPNPAPIIAEHEQDMRYGLQVLRKLTTGKLYCCVAPGTNIPGADPKQSPIVGVEQVTFDGPHPAGLPGTHIHHLDAAGEKKPVWYINYQDVIAIGQLFSTGQLNCQRVISLAGPQVTNPRLLRVPIGACVSELTANQLKEGTNRVLSGSVLYGRIATGAEDFVGRYHAQISVLAESHDREFMGWQMPGLKKFSVKPIFASAMADGLRFALNTQTNGSPRALVPVGAFESVLPMDIEPTFLLRALLTGDSEQAALLGALELDEEDLGLCTFVDPGKNEFGPLLRKILTHIEKEG
ncbi:MAG: Na(+)-translocating NADH-quinone reductase subunit A [Planctomycetaceae bacterium]|nr:Na(+)-translocating NADH-quinone reductase subunit A [Planctomycetaceae bacterium]